MLLIWFWASTGCRQSILELTGVSHGYSYPLTLELLCYLVTGWIILTKQVLLKSCNRKINCRHYGTIRSRERRLSWELPHLGNIVVAAIPGGAFFPRGEERMFWIKWMKKKINTCNIWMNWGKMKSGYLYFIICNGTYCKRFCKFSKNGSLSQQN